MGKQEDGISGYNMLEVINGNIQRMLVSFVMSL